MWGLSNSDKVIVVLTGVGEKEYSTKEIYEAIDKLQQKSDKPTTEINIDYYEELKAKADAYDLIMKLTGTGDARLTITDKGTDELRPYLNAVKKFKKSEGK